MRISDNRYNRDRTRFDVALRMVGHRARSLTIKLWTGLSEDRIRKLYKAYARDPSPLSARRYRGKSPRQEGYFLHTAALRFEATTLASLLDAAGLLSRGVTPGLWPEPQAGADLENARALCEAYEVYTRICPAPNFSFEHAYFLLLTLRRRERLTLSRCVQCGRLYLDEPARMRPPSCGCGARHRGWPRRGRMPKALIEAYDGARRLAG